MLSPDTVNLQEKHSELSDFSLVKRLDFVEIYLNNLRTTTLVKYLTGVTVDLEKAIELVNHVYPLIKDGAVYGITDATAPHLDITSEARNYYKNNKSINLSVAHAIVVKALHVRIIAKIFIQFDKPPVPTNIFNDFNSAYLYLKNFKNN